MARDNYQTVTMNLVRSSEEQIAAWATVRALHPRSSGSEILYKLVQKEAQAIREEDDAQIILQEILNMMKDVRTMLEASIEDGKELCSTTQE